SMFPAVLLQVLLTVAPVAANLTHVSNILDGLLSNYDRRARPLLDSDQPLEIRISVNIRSMGPVSDKDMAISLDCYFRQLWTDKRLAFSLNDTGFESFQLNEKFLNEIWRPDTFFLNGHASYLHNITSPNVLIRIKHTGEILYSMRLTIKARCPMDFSNYPMDRQRCPLRIGSHGYPLTEIRYAWRPGQSRIETAASLMMAQFDLVASPAGSGQQRLARRGIHSVLAVDFVLKRHIGFFLIQLYFPCALLVVLSWVSFWLNREATADRVALCIMTVLSMAFLFMDCRSDLPRVGYSTALDWYVALCFTFVLSTLLQFAVVHHFTKHGTGEVYLSMDSDASSSDSGSVDEVGQVSSAAMSTEPRELRRRRLGRCLRDAASCLRG
uniref:Neur_chan_LBD domain-containing protein n=1 Tax=Macrostomum lignano TaxID=282301 RepID=A0A1I8HG99_9PLAT